MRFIKTDEVLTPACTGCAAEARASGGRVLPVVEGAAIVQRHRNEMQRIREERLLLENSFTQALVKAGFKLPSQRDLVRA